MGRITACAAAGFAALAIMAAPATAAAQAIMLNWNVGCSPQDAPNFLPVWGPKLDALIESYASASDVRARKELFGAWGGGGEWGEDGVVRTRNELLPIASDTTATEAKVTRLGAVIGGDLWSARGAWAAEGADGPRHYVADFRRDKVFGRRWYIWRIRRFRPEEAPPLPARFCFTKELTPLW